MRQIIFKVVVAVFVVFFAGLAAEAQCRQIWSEAAQSYKGVTLVVDTNTLMDSPYVLLQFPGAHLVIPYEVIRELDALKGGIKARDFL